MSEAVVMAQTQTFEEYVAVRGPCGFLVWDGNVLAKTGSRDRVQAAIVAIQSGLA